MDIRAIQEDGPRMSRSEYQIRQPIETFEKRRLSAPGRTEDGEDLPRVDGKANILEGLNGLIIEIEILDNYLGLWRHDSPSGPTTDIPVEQPVCHRIDQKNE